MLTLAFLSPGKTLLAVMFAALLLGFALRPTSSIFKSSYDLANSLSEVMFRLCKDVSRIWWLPLFFLSAAWTEKFRACGLSFAAVSGAGLLTILLGLALLPLLYFVATGFRENPFRRIFRLLPALLPAFFMASLSSQNARKDASG
mgnify:CR=1 FL=1